MGYNVERDREGRVQAFKSSWGNASYTHTTNGGLTRIESTRGGDNPHPSNCPLDLSAKSPVSMRASRPSTTTTKAALPVLRGT